jgi:cell division protein FtsW
MMKKVISKMNIPLLLLMLVYSVFGLIMIFSASSVTAVLRYGYDSNHFFVRQLIWLLGSYFIGFIILFIPTKFYRFVSKIAMYGIIGVLALIFFAGSIAGGAKSWYDTGLFSIQPTEFAKIILIVYMAVYYNKIASKKNMTFMQFFWPIILAALLFVLIAMQPNLGGAIIVFLITIMLFFSLPFGKGHKKNVLKLGVGGVVVGLAALLLFGGNLLEPYQVRRLTEFSNPCQRYSDESGYQVCNGYIAIHNGGLFGVGLGDSTQKYSYLPEAHTDFIFPIICEELGAIIGIIVVFGYMVMLYLVLRVAKSTYNIRDSILCYGVFGYMLAHILINLLGVLGLIPLTGVPLPFLSYGGSYALSLIVGLFIVHRVNIENKLEKSKQLIKSL